MEERKIQADPEKTEALKKLCKDHNKLAAAIAESASADYTKYDPEVRDRTVREGTVFVFGVPQKLPFQ